MTTPPGPSAEPHLRIGGLALWVIDREFPQAGDFWDGNWLDARARLEAPGCVVEAGGTFVRTTDLESFLAECRRMEATVSGEARLASLEPNVAVTLRCSHVGHVAIEVSLTPDHMNQRHDVRFEADQTVLRPLVRALEALLERFPVRGRP